MSALNPSSTMTVFLMTIVATQVVADTTALAKVTVIAVAEITPV
jgi:hypothetical protein